MGTRSAIAVELENEIRAVYCHWDGYIEHNGRILEKHYDLEKTIRLIELGDLSSLGPEIGEQHSFDNPHPYGTEEFNQWLEEKKNYCTFYGRDRGEENISYRVYKNADDFYRNFDSGEEFYYLLARNGRWYVRDLDSTAPWRRLDLAIKELKESDE